MSQTISLIEWLKSTLYLLGVWDIFEQTTSKNVNDEDGELWTCNIAFDIPIRYQREQCTYIVQRGMTDAELERH